jgi:hypothetical protein
MDRPFVHHNLISAQEIPVHLPKFQMAPQTYNLNILWVQERNPGILSFSLKRSWQANPLHVPQQGPHGERSRLQGIVIYLLIYLSISKALRKERPSMFPKRWAPMETDSHNTALLNPFQSRDAIWHHTFNSALHMLQFWGARKG